MFPESTGNKLRLLGNSYVVMTRLHGNRPSHNVFRQFCLPNASERGQFYA